MIPFDHQCFFCGGAVEPERRASSNACAACSEEIHNPGSRDANRIAEWDAVDPDFRSFRDDLEFGYRPVCSRHVDPHIMEAARAAKWAAKEGTFEHHKAAYWFKRLWDHNAACANARAV